ncbi:hypothetical protein [Garciella nitratireducens]|uniref:hypothetical protein n=1 Tax=Garciella nitratireducens TaxID=218205 RepID=UPI000DE86DCB|nr:hypothetical protein [Garciella nitratireducens]RBP44176.1 hypothetical protein DFR81_105121 [Garciella nitratireducens]
MKDKPMNKDKEILYAIPIYKEGQGDISKVLYEGGGETFHPFHIRTLIRKIAYENYIDVISLKRKIQEQLGRKNTIPYPFHERLILIPVKVRKPRLKKDGAFGYINYVWVDRIQEEGKHCSILFKDQTTLKVLQHYQTIKSKMLQGAWIKDSFLPELEYSMSKKKQNSLCREELQNIIGQLMDMYKEL